MERVAFLIEDTGQHITCLLNPETVVMTRTAGVASRQVSGGRLTGAGLADDPLMFTGGGRTELKLDLLFDVDLAPAHLTVRDVRQMTRAIWALAENSAEVERQFRPPLVMLLWGSAWSIPGIITEVAERFDRFATDGSPLRSWLRLTLVRVGTAADREGGEAWELQQRLPPVDLAAPPVGTLGIAGDGAPADPTTGAPTGATIDPAQLGLLSRRAFGTELLWKQLLHYNGVEDPLEVSGPLAVPPLGETP
ncbi:hypothetical protein [Aestuariimicrobium sp. Y1814]|uniref:CIS tube protein n=1 Tax=Aestuariimicrobium sp. Y1814 TaxID=3418742 RepID=UPI003DA7783C